jgi:hypothetical protein
MDNQSLDTSQSGEKVKTASRKSVMINVASHQQLEKAAKALGVSNADYASGAIAYFARLGLNPTDDASHGIGEIGAKVSAETLAVRKQNVDIGNRFISIIRAWEANLYGFMRQQELAQNTYLAAIERNILERVVAMETNFMGPMVEQILKASIESYAGRIVGERIYLYVLNEESTEESIKEAAVSKVREKWPSQHASLSKERDQILAQKLEEYVTAHPRVRTTVTPKPALTPVPVKPVAPPAAGMPAPATAATLVPTGPAKT